MCDKFDFHQFPNAYLCENDNSKELRENLVKNMNNRSKCDSDILMEAFFSKENVNIINKKLIMRVFKESKNKVYISPQDPKKLMIVMKYIYQEYAKHLPFKIEYQIEELNCLVVGDIYKKVLSNAMQKVNYLVEINTPRKILPPPINVNNLDKTLPSFSEIYHR